MSEESEDDQISICSGGIFSDNMSITSQSDVTSNDVPSATRPKVDLSLIRNKQKRSALYQKLKKEAKKVGYLCFDTSYSMKLICRRKTNDCCWFTTFYCFAVFAFELITHMLFKDRVQCFSMQV